MDEEFHAERMEHLKSIALAQGLSAVPSQYNTCNHLSSLNFVAITVNEQGEYWETWDCPVCGLMHYIPYDAGGITL